MSVAKDSTVGLRTHTEIYIYKQKHTHIHTHIYIYICIFICIRNDSIFEYIWQSYPAFHFVLHLLGVLSLGAKSAARKGSAKISGNILFTAVAARRLQNSVHCLLALEVFLELRSCRSTVFLVDEAAEQLWSVSTDTGAEIRIPKDKGRVFTKDKK